MHTYDCNIKQPRIPDNCLLHRFGTVDPMQFFHGNIGAYLVKTIYDLIIGSVFHFHDGIFDLSQHPRLDLAEQVGSAMGKKTGQMSAVVLLHFFGAM